MKILESLDQKLSRLSTVTVMLLALLGVAVVGAIDFLSGYEVAFSLFYLAPVAFASWYKGSAAGILVALLSCVSWYGADQIAGHTYSHVAIPVWNALVRLGFFLITGLLISSLRTALINQKQLASTDALTGLYSRRSFDDRLAHDLALAKRSLQPLTVAYLDLDNFKQINDQLGHAVGDRLLQTLGGVLLESVRISDTPARLGGDEFALILPNTSADEAREVIRKIRSRLTETMKPAGWEVSCSIGVTTTQGVDMTAHQILNAADELMYSVKKQGKDGVAFRVLDTDLPPAPGDGR